MLSPEKITTSSTRELKRKSSAKIVELGSVLISEKISDTRISEEIIDKSTRE